jgi:hypothetical protein
MHGRVGNESVVCEEPVLLSWLNDINDSNIMASDLEIGAVADGVTGRVW